MSRPKEFTETDGFLGPAGTKTYVESPYAKQKREYEEVMKIQDPREKELAMGNRPDLFSPMSPDDMMMSAPPLAGSELAQQQATAEVLEEQLHQDNNHKLQLFQLVQLKNLVFLKRYLLILLVA
jgi:hypothetical protein